MAQLYYSAISINAAQVPSTQTDFPVLVSQTDNRFKTIGNGGHVNNSSGFDIRPYSDTGLTTALTYELERYNASTGEVIMWVKVGSLSSSTTPIYLGYGDTSISTDGSSTSTWSNSFLGVYHLKDGTTLNVNSSTGSNNGTNHSATATSGKIDGAASFASASSQYIDLSNGMNPSAITISAWINATSFPAAYNSIVVRRNGATNYSVVTVKSSGKLAMFSYAGGDVSYDGTGTNTLSTSTNYLIHWRVFNGSPNSADGFVNGSVDKSVASSNPLATTASSMYIANDPGASAGFFNGKIDEVRIASAARSADWITTEYNNQNAPGTFETLGTEVVVGSSNPSNFFLLFT